MNTATSPMAGLQRFTRAKEERFTFKKSHISGKLIDSAKPITLSDKWLCWSHHSGKSYTVDISQCDCPDFVHRQGPAGKVCKHVLALREYLKEDHG